MNATIDDSPPIPEIAAQTPRWKLGLAVIWLVGFSAFFFSRPMPNVGGTFAATRWEAWQQLPWVVLDWVMPAGSRLSTENSSNEIPSGWQFLPERLVLWGWAGLILAGAWGLGHLVLCKLISRNQITPLERFVFAVGAGLSLVSLLTLGLGFVGALHRGIFLAGLGSTTLAGIGELFWSGRNRSERASPQHASNQSQGGWWWMVLILLPFLVPMLLGGVTPSTDFDVKEYHFGGPKEFYLAGRVQFLPHNVYTSFPFLTEMLTLLGMVLRQDWYFGALVGKAVLMALIPLSGLAILAAGRRWFGEWAGRLGMLVWLSTPWATRTAIIAYAEGGLACYLFLAFFATGLAVQKLASGKLSPGLFLLAGLLAGSAMACKYTGLVSVVFPLGVAVMFSVFRFSRQQAGEQSLHHLWLRTLGVFSVGVMLAVGPWLLKNLVETGNPVYPLAWSIFGGRDWNAGLNAQWTKAHSPPHYDVSSFILPIDGAPAWIVDVTATNDWLSPLLYALAPLILLVPCFRKTALLIWVYVAWLFVGWWAFTHRLDRFWVPMLPVTALLAGGGAVWCSTRFWKIACGVVIASSLLFNFVLIATQNAGYIAWLSDLNKAREFTARLTSPEIAYLNQNLANDDSNLRVLSVGDAEVFDARFPIVYNTVFDQSIFQAWTEDPASEVPPTNRPMRTAAEIREKFHQEGITHIFVNWQEILRYRPTYGYAEYIHPQRFAQLVESGVLEAPTIINRRAWDQLSQSEQDELRKTGWRDALREPGAYEETITLSGLYRVR